MKTCTQIATLLAAVCAAAALVERCAIQGTTMDCSYRGLVDVVPGYWPDVQGVSLSGNPIAQLYKGSFSGFPNVKTLTLLYDEELEVLELEVLAGLPHLQLVSFAANRIHTVVPAPAGVSIDSVQELFLAANQLTTLDPDVLLGAPNLMTVVLPNNPLVVPHTGAFLNHPKLREISIDHCNAEGLNPESLAGLPDLRHIALRNASVASIAGAFATSPALWYVDLEQNPLKEVVASSFAAAGALYDLRLSSTALERLDVSALNGALRSGGRVFFRDTPLACACGYETLFWWADAKDITLYAECEARCSFTRREG